MKTEKVIREIQRWEAIRQKGKKRFILLAGVLGWGVSMFVLMTFVLEHAAVSRSLPLLAGVAGLWLLGGAAFGWLLWITKEKRYQSLISK